MADQRIKVSGDLTSDEKFKEELERVKAKGIFRRTVQVILVSEKLLKMNWVLRKTLFKQPTSAPLS